MGLEQYLLEAGFPSLLDSLMRRHVAIVQGVKDRIGLKSSDVDQGLKICIHGQFHILN